MAKHDIVTYNSSSKGFETELNNNTAQIKGDASTIFSVESASGASIFSVGTSNTSTVFGANLTSSGHISSSLSSTASFAKVEFISITGSGALMSNVDEIGHISTSAQLSTAISGAFNAGFQTTGDISGSRTSSGSFGTVFANEYEGDASQMTNVNESGHISSSAQLASAISGSFIRGFDLSSKSSISGSATSTGSFGKLNANKYVGDASNVTNIKVHEVGFISSSAQLATSISGSFNKGFEFSGEISGSRTSTGSFDRFNIGTKIIADNADSVTNVSITAGTVSSSAQLASKISGSFNKGFGFTGAISGNATSTGSFGVISANTYTFADVSGVTNLFFSISASNAVSTSAQLATAISGSFKEGFEFTGEISGSRTSTGSFSSAVAQFVTGDISALTNVPLNGVVSSSAQLASAISGSFNKGFGFSGEISGSRTSTGSFGRLNINDNVQGNLDAVTVDHTNIVSSSGQLATAISGSFNKGFGFTGEISGSADSTGSFSLLSAQDYQVTNVNVSNAFPTAVLSTDISAFSAAISGAFTSGFVTKGKISGSADSTGSLSSIEANIFETKKMNVVRGYPISASSTVSGSNLTQSFQSFTNKPFVIPYVETDFYDTRQFMPGSSSKQTRSCGSCGDQYASDKNYGTDHKGIARLSCFQPEYEGGAQISIGREGVLNVTFQTSSFVAANSRGIQPAAWSEVADLLNATRPPAVGTTNAALAISGKTTTPGACISNTQHYNGVSWRQGDTIPSANGVEGSGQAYGTQNAAGSVPSYTTGAMRRNLHYNGMSWYYIQYSNNNETGQGSAGTQNAALKWGGSTTEGYTEEFNGTSWFVAAEFNNARAGGVGGGTQNDAVQIGGQANANACRNLTEKYDGTTWTNGPAHPMVNQSAYGAASGNSTDLHAIGSSYVSSEDYACSIVFDGNTWSSNPNRPTSRHQAGMAGQGASGLAVGGGPENSNPAGASVSEVYEFHSSFMSGSYLLTKKIGGNLGFSGSQG